MRAKTDTRIWCGVRLDMQALRHPKPGLCIEHRGRRGINLAEKTAVEGQQLEKGILTLAWASSCLDMKDAGRAWQSVQGRRGLSGGSVRCWNIRSLRGTLRGMGWRRQDCSRQGVGWVDVLECTPKP